MRKDKVSGIYCIENIQNNKKYIGKSVNVHIRFIDHRNKLINNKHKNIYLQHSWNKYREENFKFYLIQECPEEQLDDLEMEIIEYYNTTNPNFGYNVSIGGDGGMIGHKHSEETKKMLSEMEKGEGNPFYGKRHTEETKERISKTKKGIVNPLVNVSYEDWTDAMSKSQRHIKKPGKNNHVGIYFHDNYPSLSCWEAKISLGKSNRKFLGLYPTEQEAIIVWENAYFEYYGGEI